MGIHIHFNLEHDALWAKSSKATHDATSRQITIINQLLIDISKTLFFRYI